MAAASLKGFLCKEICHFWGHAPLHKLRRAESGRSRYVNSELERRDGFEFPAPGRISHNFDHSRKVPQPVFVQANASVRERQTFGLWRLLKCPVEAICKRNQIWPFSGARVGENLTSYSCVTSHSQIFRRSHIYCPTTFYNVEMPSEFRRAEYISSRCTSPFRGYLRNSPFYDFRPLLSIVRRSHLRPKGRRRGG